jgi:hypothetical protein
MTTTTPATHAADLRARLNQVHDSIARLEAEQAEAEQAVQQALEQDDTAVIVAAQSRASAARDALATRRRTADTIAVELAQAEAEEQREAVFQLLIGEAKSADRLLNRHDDVMAQEAEKLDTSVRKILTLRRSLREHRNRFLDAAKKLLPRLHNVDRESQAAGDALAQELERRGAPLRALAVLEFAGFHNPFRGHGEPYFPLRLDGAGEALPALVERMEVAELQEAAVARSRQERARQEQRVAEVLADRGAA